ncbi:unnamed protein product [Rotaria sordida]|uniref:LITAF domain-containing protein n=1 Tax=Rotaria sordida TaxID=392033 RepID=A0A814YAI0_9BILA|nr:unnamed protein product [Rotaria sordida]CAF1218917.1 unnamed protein product [Rotaria sordida]CAF1226883.1 unnamed protein product [Rotaria sordida]
MTETKPNQTTSPYTQESISTNEHPLGQSASEFPMEPPPKYDDARHSPAPVNRNVQQVPHVVTIVQPRFGDLSVQCTCPNCHQTIVTRVERSNGILVWLICGILILVGCWLGCCLVPFCIDELKDTTHYCPNCGIMLGKNKKL